MTRLVNLGIFFCMFSSFAFLPISSEFQPIGIGLLWVIFLSKGKFLQLVSYYEIFFLLLIILSIVMTFAQGKFTFSSVEVILALLAYLTFHKLRSLGFLNISIKYLDTVIVTMTILALLQFLTPSGLAPKISGITSQIIPRHWFGVYPGGRGVSLLFSEPAHAAKLILLLINLFLIGIERDFYGNYKKWLLMACLVFLILTNASGSIILYLIICVVIYLLVIKPINLKYFALNKYYFLVLLTMSISLLLLVWQVPRFFEKIVILSSLFSSFFQSGVSIEQWTTFSGIRLISVYYGFLYGFENFFPVGLGASRYGLIDFMANNGVDVNNIWFLKVTNFRPLQANSFNSQIFADLGFIGFTVLTMITINLICQAHRSKSKVQLVFTFVYITLLFINSNLLPVHLWLGLFLSLNGKLTVRC